MIAEVSPKCNYSMTTLRETKLFVFRQRACLHMVGSTQPRHFFAKGRVFADFEITLIFPLDGGGPPIPPHIGTPW